jgi:hypothetical protein
MFRALFLRRPTPLANYWQFSRFLPIICHQFSAFPSIFAIQLKLDLIINDINSIIAKLGDKQRFSKKELLDVLRQLHPDKKETTLSWRIYDLKEKGIVSPVTRGFYTLTARKQSFLPVISAETKELYQRIRQELPYTEISIAHTGWFNEFMVHQVFRTYLVMEVEKEAMSAVFNKLSEQGKKVFLDPGREVFDFYISHTENPIIIKPLISESPFAEVDEIKIASLEKLLVDCVCDQETYSAQYQEVNTIFENALEKYAVNLGRLTRYARRRNKAKKIMALIHSNQQHD